MFLLDTNHCSRILDNDQHVLAHIAANAASPMATSVITEGELFFMAERSNARAGNLIRVSALISGIRIYSIDSTTAKLYGELKAALFDHYGPKEKAKRRRTTIGQLGFSDNDLWITALALQHNLTIVSSDSDFTRIQSVRRLRVANWTAEPAEAEQ